MRMVGETDTTTGELTGAIVRTWLNLGLREFSNYGVFLKETTYVTAAGRDTFRLPVDYVFAHRVTKTIGGAAHDYPLSDSAPGFYERTDTIIQSTSVPNVNMTKDVFEVRTAWRKETGSLGGAIKGLVRIAPESTQRVAAGQSDYYYFIGQPFPRITFGKKASFGDTVFAEVVAVLPSYTAYDTGGVATTDRGFFRLFPPAVRSDTIKMTYAAELDTIPSVDTAAQIQGLPLNVRPALPLYMMEKYYRKHGFTAEAEKALADWRGILVVNAIMREIRIALPK